MQGIASYSAKSYQPYVAAHHGFLLVSSWALGVLLVLTYCIFIPGHRELVFVSVFFLGLTALPVVFALARGQYDIMAPIYVISGLYALYFGARTLFLLTGPVNPFMSPRLGGSNLFRDLLSGMLYALLGFVFFLVGYYSPFSCALSWSLPQVIRSEWDSDKVRRVAFILYVIGAGFHLLNLSRGRGQVFFSAPVSLTFQYLIDFIGGFRSFAFSLLWISFFGLKRRSRSMYLLLGGITIAEFGFAFLSGRKQAAISLLFLWLIPFHYFRRRLSFRTVLTLGLIAILIVFPLFTLYRLAYWTGIETGTFSSSFSFSRDVPLILSGFRTMLRTYTLRSYVDLAADAFLNRFAGVDSFALVVRDTPPVWDYQYGRTLSYLFISIIPRAVWPGKPVLSIGRWFALSYYGFPPTNLSSVAITQIGDLYLNFGWAGVFLGMLLLGMFNRVCYGYLIRSTKPSPVQVFFYSLVFLQLITIEMNIATSFAPLFKLLLAMLMVHLLVHKKKRKGSVR